MSALLKEVLINLIDKDIEMHPSWLGQVAGIKAEKMLRGKRPYQYVLRAGEASDELDVTHYYVTFVKPDLSIHHQPFVITLTLQGWTVENGGLTGPFKNATIEDVLHLIMHCQKNECSPLVNFQKK